MEASPIPLEFDCKGSYYKGWATPSVTLDENGLPTSYMVILNQVFFGDMSKIGDKWTLDSRRPHELIALIDECVNKAIEGIRK